MSKQSDEIEFDIDDSLSDLLRIADRLFTTKRNRKRPNEIIDYSLNRFPSGWRFSVTNDWHKWHDKGLRFDTDIYATPESAVQAFLVYVQSGGISVRRLMS